MINTLKQNQDSLFVGHDVHSLAVRRTEACVYCDPSISAKCGIKYPAGSMLYCTRPIGHSGLHAACGPEQHPLELW